MNMHRCFICCIILVAIYGCKRETYPGPKVIEYMNLDAIEVSRQSELNANGLQEIAPVLLPEGDMEEVTRSTRHLFMGWPHGVIIDDIIIVYIRYPSTLIRSADGGETWEEPIFADSVNNAVMCATRSGKVVALAVDQKHANTVNVLISEDKGVSWKSHRAAVPGTPPSLTSRMIEHPKYGLIAGAHHSGNTRRDSIYFLNSKDEGQTWQKVSFHVDVPLITHGNIVLDYGGNRFGCFVRNQLGPGSWRPFAQFAPTNIDSAERFEDLIWKGAYTNIWVTKDDTPDAVYNPVSGRIEAMTTKRGDQRWIERLGGFPSRDGGYMTLNLWSTSVEDFQQCNGNWRFEGTLLRSKGEWGWNRDGMHPSGSIIDKRRGRNHIFVYMGSRSHVGPESGRTGIFRISRTLKTEEWVSKNNVLDNYEKIFRIDEDFSSLGNWKRCGNPRMSLTVPPNINHSAISFDSVGLSIKNDEPGYCGLLNENIIVTRNYTMSIKAKIVKFPRSGYALGLHTNYGAEKYDLLFKEDGIYELTKHDPEQHIKLIDTKIDNEWHTWKVEVNQGRSRIYKDEAYIGSGSTRIDEGIGHRPLCISSLTADSDDLSAVQIAKFSFENTP